MDIPSDTAAQGPRRRTPRSAWLLAAALAAASLGAVGQALAQTAAPLTRAEVTAELQRARASGELERSMPESFHMIWLYPETGQAVAPERGAADAARGATDAASQPAEADRARTGR